MSDEPHLWTTTTTTNAWMPGEESVAEQTAAYPDKIAKGKPVDVGLMRYHPKAIVADLADAAQIRRGLERMYPDVPWVDVDPIIAEVHDLGTHPADARRYNPNEIISADDAWIAPTNGTPAPTPTCASTMGQGTKVSRLSKHLAGWAVREASGNFP